MRNGRNVKKKVGGGKGKRNIYKREEDRKRKKDRNKEIEEKGKNRLNM